ncbi:MAG: helix-hairpin-helix domain-containing protein [Candidatus Omnitrophota bacterium]
MLIFSRSDRQTIVSVLLIGVFIISLSYYKKIDHQPDNITLDIKEGIGLVNINTAAYPELERLPGIGPALARAIVLYRQDRGAFKDKEDIKDVNGIGRKKFDKIKELITIDE